MKVCFVYSNRSEYSLLLPIIKYFKNKTSVKEINLSKKVKNIELDRNLSEIYSYCLKDFLKNNYDYVCVLGDRRELPSVAFATLYSEIKLVHIAAGEYAQGIPTYDQYVRPIVSILSKYQICFSKKAENEVKKLFKGISYLKSNTVIIGNPVFNDIDISSLKRIIEEDYDMVLLHPQSLSREQTRKDIKEIQKKLKNRKTIFIEGNKDKNKELVEKFYLKNKSYKNNIFFESLPKKKYFSLVKYCENFYTNSSSISEIKFLNKKCLNNIGTRNKNRFVSNLDKNSPIKLYNLLKKDFNPKKHQNQTS